MSEPDADLHEKPVSTPADDGSVRASVARLLASGRELAEAEFAWARLKTALIADGLRKWLMFASLAMIFLILGVVILIGSAIIALASFVGSLFASLIVAGACIVAAVISALFARRAFLAIFDEDGV